MRVVDIVAAGRPAAVEAPAVSVVVPTYHRPLALRRAVRSVLAQEGAELAEVVIALSDPAADADRRAAEGLAEDHRVRIVEAPRPGPAAARNAAIRAARAPLIALLDDDCEVQPGWLAAGVAALDAADLVQGRTLPERARRGYERSLWVDRLTGLWESCNLFVRREAVDDAGLFDEHLNPTGTVGKHWGEDTEWGWRLVRAGARPAYADGALVLHAVEPRTFVGWLRRRTEIRWFPYLVTIAPEVRGRFHHDYFFNRRHVAVWMSIGLGSAAGVGGAAGRRGLAAGLSVAAVAVYGSTLRRARNRTQLRAMVRHLPEQMVTEAVEVASLVYGSVRYRRVLL